MQGVALLLLSGASLYLVHKLFSFIKELQAIQYAKHPMINAISLTCGIIGTSPGNALSFHR